MKDAITIQLAENKDDLELRSLLKSMDMPGEIRISFCREPSFFNSLKVEGNMASVVIAKRNNEIVGMGTRSEKEVFVNGCSVQTGYLSGLRVKPRHRSLKVLNEGYDLLNRIHRQRPVKFYLSTITSENSRVSNLLKANRFGLPNYINQGVINSHVIHLGRKAYHHKINDLKIRCAKSSDIGNVVKFLNTEGKKRQFFPKYTEKDFGNGLLMGLNEEDVFLAYRDNKIVGTLALWNQGEYKQTMVTGYGRKIRYFKWLINLGKSFNFFPYMKKPPFELPIRTLVLCCIKEDEYRVFNSLIKAINNKLFKSNCRSIVLLGLHERDPLNKTARKWSKWTYKSNLYVVGWEDSKDFIESIDSRIPYIELGAL